MAAGKLGPKIEDRREAGPLDIIFYDDGRVSVRNIGHDDLVMMTQEQALGLADVVRDHRGRQNANNRHKVLPNRLD